MLQKSFTPIGLRAVKKHSKLFSLSKALYTEGGLDRALTQSKEPLPPLGEFLEYPEFASLLVRPVSETTPDSVEKHFANLLEKKAYKGIWNAANALKKAEQSRQLVSPGLYCTLLKTIRMRLENTLIEKQQVVKLASMIYAEAVSEKMHIFKDYQYEQLARDVLSGLAHSEDVADLFTLRMIYQNYITETVSNSKFELYYLRTHLSILLNTGQEERAFELFEQAYNTLSHSTTKTEILRILPAKQLLRVMAARGESELLCKWIKAILADTLDPDTRFFSNLELLKLLGSGLEANNYDLVKTIYDEMQLSGDSEDSLAPLLSLSADSAVYQMLHVFAMNGDVNLTLQLIEAYFMKKHMKGESALTKELCVLIITAYCYNNDPNSNWDEKEMFQTKKSQDDSLKLVIDIINEMNSKFLRRNDPKNVTYRDITTAFSFKLMNYKAYDANIERAVTKAESISKRILNLGEETVPEVRPRKISNTNIQVSKYGNILKNLDVLADFVAEHVGYIVEKKYFPETMNLFINCVLSHINTHQNFSGIVRMLMAAKAVDPINFSSWIDRDLLDIMLNSMSKSRASKKCSLELFKYLQNSPTYSLTHADYHCLISASLLGEENHRLVEFYLYRYLKDMGHVRRCTIELLQKLSQDKWLAALVQLLQSSSNTGAVTPIDIVDLVWTKEGLNSAECPTDLEEDNESEHSSYFAIDNRDAKFLKYVLE